MATTRNALLFPLILVLGLPLFLAGLGCTLYWLARSGAPAGPGAATRRLRDSTCIPAGTRGLDIGGGRGRYASELVRAGYAMSALERLRLRAWSAHYAACPRKGRAS